MKTFAFCFFTIFFLASCTNKDKRNQTTLEIIDSLTVTKNFDEAYNQILKIPPYKLTNNNEKALFYLLKVQTLLSLDKKIVNDSAINFCIDYYKKTNNKEKLARAYYYKGIYELANKKTKDALLFIKKAESTEKEVNTPWLKYLININISYINSISGVNNIALKYAKKALEIGKQENNIQWICYAYNNIAICYNDIGEKDSAYIYINKIRPHLHEIKSKEDHAAFLTNIGFFYYEDANYHKAETLYKEAVQLIQDPHPMINLIKTYYMLNKDNEADSLLQSTWPETDHELKAEMLQFLAERAEKQGDFKVATKFYKQAKEHEDSAKMDKDTEEAITTQQAYDMEKKEEETSRKEMMAGVIIIIAIAILAAVATRYHQKKINKAKKAIADNGMTIKELTAKVDELERADRKHSHEADALRRKIRKLKDEQNEILGRGQRLYDDITAGGNTATWKKQDFDEFIEFYRVSHPDVVADAEDNYKRLSSTNIFYLILTDMGRGDDDAQRIMCMTAGALRTMKSRINGKRKNA